MQLKGVLAIVTGGASGLGAGTATALAGAGAHVAIWDRNLEPATALATRLGGRAYEVDVTDEGSVQRALDAALAWQPDLRVLVNCAGIAGGWRVAGRKGPHPLDAFRRVIEVNLVGSFNCARLCAQAMLERPALARGERGVLIHTSSIAAYEGQVGQSAYSASKGALASLALTMARDLAEHGIRCLAIAPGLFNTPMVAGLDAEIRAKILAGVPFPAEFGEPEDFASLVLECCHNAMLNGTVLRLDAATRLQPR